LDIQSDGCFDGRAAGMTLSGDERFRATDGVEFTQVPDGAVIYDEAGKQVHYLNPTATIIYLVCDGSRTVNDIQELVREAYEFEDAPDLDEFFASLEQARLVCRAG
jgi:hypothetical protein